MTDRKFITTCDHIINRLEISEDSLLRNLGSNYLRGSISCDGRNFATIVNEHIGIYRQMGSLCNPRFMSTLRIPIDYQFNNSDVESTSSDNTKGKIGDECVVRDMSWSPSRVALGELLAVALSRKIHVWKIASSGHSPGESTSKATHIYSVSIDDLMKTAFTAQQQPCISELNWHSSALPSLIVSLIPNSDGPIVIVLPRRDKAAEVRMLPLISSSSTSSTAASITSSESRKGVSKLHCATACSLQNGYMIAASKCGRIFYTSDALSRSCRFIEADTCRIQTIRSEGDNISIADLQPRLRLDNKSTTNAELRSICLDETDNVLFATLSLSAAADQLGILSALGQAGGRVRTDLQAGKKKVTGPSSALSSNGDDEHLGLDEVSGVVSKSRGGGAFPHALPGSSLMDALYVPTPDIAHLLSTAAATTSTTSDPAFLAARTVATASTAAVGGVKKEFSQTTSTKQDLCILDMSTLDATETLPPRHRPCSEDDGDAAAEDVAVICPKNAMTERGVLESLLNLHKSGGDTIGSDSSSLMTSAGDASAAAFSRALSERPKSTGVQVLDPNSKSSAATNNDSSVALHTTKILSTTSSSDAVGKSDAVPYAEIRAYWLHDDCGSAGAASKIRADSVVADSERGDDGNITAEIPVCEHTLTVPIFDPLLKRPDVLACSRLDRSTPREKAKGREDDDDAYFGLTNMISASGTSPWGLLAVGSSQSNKILVYEVQYYSERQATAVSIGQLEYNATKTSTTTMPMSVVLVREINIPENEKCRGLKILGDGDSLLVLSAKKTARAQQSLASASSSSRCATYLHTFTELKTRSTKKSSTGESMKETTEGRNQDKVNAADCSKSSSIGGISVSGAYGAVGSRSASTTSNAPTLLAQPTPIHPVASNASTMASRAFVNPIAVSSELGIVSAAVAQAQAQEAALATIISALNTLQASMNARFDQMDAKLSAQQATIDGVVERLSILEQRNPGNPRSS